MATTETKPGVVAPPPARVGEPTAIRRMEPGGPPLLRFYRTAVGKKWVMAITGIALMLFVLVHLIGNIKLFLSKEEINLYGEALRDMPGHLLPRTWLLWTIRTGLIASFFFHIHAAYGLTVINRRARPTRYQSKRDYVAADFASRTMRWTGIIVLAFVAFHLADLTWGAANGSHFVRGDPYDNLVYSFRRPVVAIAYVIANLALGIHIYHGAWSLFQSLGVNNPRYNKARTRFAQAFAAVVVVGNVSFPIAVQLHAVTPKCPTERPPSAACPSTASASRLPATVEGWR
jgi:succinate dehydrogenase / fumarate reductase, cytochrome b subunit